MFQNSLPSITSLLITLTLFIRGMNLVTTLQVQKSFVVSRDFPLQKSKAVTQYSNAMARSIVTFW